MKIRGQILLASLLTTVLPLVLVMLVVQDNVARRFAELDTRRVEDQIRLTREDLTERSSVIIGLLDGLADRMRDDNTLRLALSGERPDLQEQLIDYAPRAMSLMDLDFLLIQDAGGTVLSSGHFRGAFGLEEPRLPRLLSHVSSGHALLPARSAQGAFLALARTRALQLGGQSYHLTGGIRLDKEGLRRLGRDADLSVLLVWSEGILSSDDSLIAALGQIHHPQEVEMLLRQDGLIVRAVAMPLISEEGHASAQLLVVHDQGFMRGLLRGLNLRMGLILVVAIGLSALVAVLLSNRISLPLRRLAASTRKLDLDNLEADFATRGKDEVGQLSRLLDQMITRLRDSVGQLRSAEHRATLGEVARQVNHDIRNGLTPLRNVLRHLGQVAEDDPPQLGPVFKQRQSTLEGSLTYLEDLATHYARLSPPRNEQACHLDAVVSAALAALQTGDRVKLENKLGTNLPPVLADPVSLRRIFDNLIRNAWESLPQGQGSIAVNGFLEEDEQLAETRLIIEVADDGEGIPAENLDAIFTDFFTTRDQGTGLGLSNVRRLAADCGAQVRVSSQVGQGTTFTLSFPVTGIS